MTVTCSVIGKFQLCEEVPLMNLQCYRSWLTVHRAGREETQQQHGDEAPADSEKEGKGPDPPPVTGRPPAIGNNDDLSGTGALAGKKQLNFCFNEDTHWDIRA